MELVVLFLLCESCVSDIQRELLQVRGDVRNFIKFVRPNLTDVQINEMVVVSVNLCQFLFSKVFSINIVLNVHVLMRNNY